MNNSAEIDDIQRTSRSFAVTGALCAVELSYTICCRIGKNLHKVALGSGWHACLKRSNRQLDIERTHQIKSNFSSKISLFGIDFAELTRLVSVANVTLHKS